MAHLSTISIDVGSMFLMDLSVNESEITTNASNDIQKIETHPSTAFNNKTYGVLYHNSNNMLNSSNNQQKTQKLNKNHENKQRRMNVVSYNSIGDYREQEFSEFGCDHDNNGYDDNLSIRHTNDLYLSGSLERLARAINCDGQQDQDMAETSATASRDEHIYIHGDLSTAVLISKLTEEIFGRKGRHHPYYRDQQVPSSCSPIDGSYDVSSGSSPCASFSDCSSISRN